MATENALRGMSNKELAESGRLIAERLRERENPSAAATIEELARRVDPNPITDQ